MVTIFGLNKRHHTQEVNILLVRIFLVCLVRRLSDVTEVKCHSPLLPSLLLNYILGNSFNTWLYPAFSDANDSMHFVHSSVQIIIVLEDLYISESKSCI